MGIQFTGLASGLDTQSIIADLMKVERTRVESVEKDKTRVEWKKDAWKEMNSKLYSFYKKELYKFKSYGTYNQKTLNSSNESAVTLNKSSGAVRGVHEIAVGAIAKGSYLTGTELTTDLNGDAVTSSTTAESLFGITGADTGSFNINVDGTDHTVDIGATDTVASIVGKINELDLDLNVSYDSNFNRLFLSSTRTGADVDVRLSSSDATFGEAILNGLGFDVANRDGSDGTDASFTYNGTTFTSDTNEVSVNGLSFNIQGVGTSTVTVSQDTDAIYESVKEFVLAYNSIIDEMNVKIDADSARDYDPLTADEKSAMTDNEIELWENKIKDSLLRRDDTLTNIRSAIRDTLTISSGVDATNFKYKSLSELGVVTGSYSEKGLLHIEGDEDDPLYSVKDNKLREAIEEDPEAVGELLTALGEQLYDDFNDRMKSTTLSSAFTFYNDKQIDKEISAYEDDIFDLEDRMASIEERYYKQFTAMEQAIQQSNSTGEWLAQQLGGM